MRSYTFFSFFPPFLSFFVRDKDHTLWIWHDLLDEKVRKKRKEIGMINVKPFGPPHRLCHPLVYILFPANLKLIQSIGENQAKAWQDDKMQTEDMFCWLYASVNRDQHTTPVRCWITHRRIFFFFNGGSVVVVVVQDKRCYPSLIVPGLLWNSPPAPSSSLFRFKAHIITRPHRSEREKSQNPSSLIIFPAGHFTAAHLGTNTLNQHKRSISLILYSIHKLAYLGRPPIMSFHLPIMSE